MFAVYKKELKTYMFSPIGYIFVGLFLLILSLFFYIGIFNYQYLNFEYLFYDGTTILIFVLPLLTMRLFSEERKNGTEQLLLTSPRSTTSIVLGKFFAAGTVVLFTELLTLMYYGILDYFGDPSLPIALSTLLGFFLLSLSFISIGMFISSLSENQIISAFVTIGVFLLLLFGSNIAGVFNAFNLSRFFQESFITGLVMVKNIILFLAIIILFILLTIIFLQKRKNLK